MVPHEAAAIRRDTGKFHLKKTEAKKPQHAPIPDARNKRDGFCLNGLYATFSIRMPRIAQQVMEMRRDGIKDPEGIIFTKRYEAAKYPV
jgi:hypothetical protein